MFTWFKESRFNKEKTQFHLLKYPNIELACFSCNSFYKVTDLDIFINEVNKSLICVQCNKECIIPITTDSHLYNLSSERRVDIIRKWNKQAFTTIK